MKRFIASLVAAIALAGVVVLVGSTAPAGADDPISPTYGCDVQPFDLQLDEVPVPIDVTDVKDPVAPGGTATYEVGLSLPTIGEIPANLGVDRLAVELPIPEGVTSVDVSFGQPSPQTANPPLSTWSSRIEGETLIAEFQAPNIFSRIGLKMDGSAVYPATSTDPVVPPSVTFTAQIAAEAADSTVEWNVPTLSADLIIVNLPNDLTCSPDVPSTVIASTDVCSEVGFTDVGVGSPFYCEIAWMSTEGISTGFQPGPTYKPSTAVSRQAMSAFMYRLAGSPTFEQPASQTFADVSPSHPFYDSIEWMALEGISTGTPASPKPLYKPSSPVSRQAMAAFMYRLAGSPTFEQPVGQTFGDVSPSNTFFEEIEWMALEGISNGTPASPKPLYKPSNAVSRQAMSAFMFRLAPLLVVPD